MLVNMAWVTMVAEQGIIERSDAAALIGVLRDMERAGAENKIYGMTADSTFHFDAARGSIRRIEQEYTQDYGFKGKGGGSSELNGVEQGDAARLAQVALAAAR